MPTTPVLLSGSECWPHLWIRDPNVGQTYVFWIRMLTTPMLLYGSECWSHVCFCMDPKVGHTYASVWIRMLATPMLLSGSECWPYLCFCLDPNVGHTCAFWIRMLTTPVHSGSECWPHTYAFWIRMLATLILLSVSECWPHLCFCLDPNVDYTHAAFWIRMLSTSMPLNPNVCHACASAWIRMLVMPVPLPGFQCRMLMKERKISVETVEIAFPRNCQRIDSDGPETWWKYWRNIGWNSWKCHNKDLLKEMARIFGKNEYRILKLSPVTRINRRMQYARDCRQQDRKTLLNQLNGKD
jgi:hypothetical protein